MKMKFHRNAAFISSSLNPVWDSDVGKTLQRPPKVVRGLGQTSRAENVLWLRTLNDCSSEIDRFGQWRCVTPTTEVGCCELQSCHVCSGPSWAVFAFWGPDI